MIYWGFWEVWSLEQSVPEMHNYMATYSKAKFCFSVFWCHKHERCHFKRVKVKWVVLIHRVKQVVKWQCGSSGLELVSGPAWWTQSDDASRCDKNKGLHRLSKSFVMSLNMSPTVVGMMAVHVLHCYPAPHSNHKCFNLTLIAPTSNTEETILSPVLSPGVCSNLWKTQSYEGINTDIWVHVFFYTQKTHPIFSWCSIKVSLLSPPSSQHKDNCYWACKRVWKRRYRGYWISSTSYYLKIWMFSIKLFW